MHGTIKPSRKIWTPQREQQLIRLRNSGMDCYQIAEEMNLSSGAIWTKAHRLGHGFRGALWWSEEQATRLRRLWDRGMSCSQIAKEMGLTRNAVIGKAHRLQLPTRLTTPFREHGPFQGPIRQPRQRLSPEERKRRAAEYGRKKRSQLRESLGLPPVKRGPPKIAPLWRRMDAIEPPPGTRCQIWDLTNHTCRWPYGEPSYDMLYCGAEPVEGKSYCAHHMQMAYR